MDSTFSSVLKMNNTGVINSIVQKAESCANHGYPKVFYKWRLSLYTGSSVSMCGRCQSGWLWLSIVLLDGYEDRSIINELGRLIRGSWLRRIRMIFNKEGAWNRWYGLSIVKGRYMAIDVYATSSFPGPPGDPPVPYVRNYYIKFVTNKPSVK